MKKYYQFAGIEIEISAPESIMYEEDRSLTDFSSESTVNPHTFTLEKVDNLEGPKGTLAATYPDYCAYKDGQCQIRYIGAVGQNWENGYIRVLHDGRQHHVQIKNSECNERIGVKTVLNAMSAEHLVLEADGVILHASFIEHEGKAILFTAPSGTGKSTQAELWAEHRDADIINGDRVVIRLIEGQPFACGIPFAGSSKYCKKKTLPLAAIVYLGQAPSTSISRLTGITAFTHIWWECTVNTWNPEDVEKATGIVLDTISKVPVFHLNCTPDESAVIALEEELKKIKEGAAVCREKTQNHI